MHPFKNSPELYCVTKHLDFNKQTLKKYRTAGNPFKYISIPLDPFLVKTAPNATLSCLLKTNRLSRTPNEPDF